jgi:hypothetical protein
MNPHPNATVAAVAGALSTVLQALLVRWGVTVSPTLAALITTGIVALVLVIGRDGLAGLADVIVHGQSTRTPKPPEATP